MEAIRMPTVLEAERRVVVGDGEPVDPLAGGGDQDPVPGLAGPG
jgi:hypothetical protein